MERVEGQDGESIELVSSALPPKRKLGSDGRDPAQHDELEDTFFELDDKGSCRTYAVMGGMNSTLSDPLPWVL